MEEFKGEGLGRNMTSVLVLLLSSDTIDPTEAAGAVYGDIRKARHELEHLQAIGMIERAGGGYFRLTERGREVAKRFAAEHAPV